MTTLTASEARANLYRLIDQAAESHQPIHIAGKRFKRLCSCFQCRACASLSKKAWLSH